MFKILKYLKYLIYGNVYFYLGNYKHKLYYICKRNGNIMGSPLEDFKTFFGIIRLGVFKDEVKYSMYSEDLEDVILCNYPDAVSGDLFIVDRSLVERYIRRNNFVRTS